MSLQQVAITASKLSLPVNVDICNLYLKYEQLKMGEHVRSFKTAYGKGSVCFDRIHFENYEFESLRTLFFECIEHSRDFHLRFTFRPGGY